jgi:glutathione peroxidase
VGEIALWRYQRPPRPVGDNKEMVTSDTELTMLNGRTTTFGEFADNVVLVVNVASRCGLSPQYEALEQLQKTYGDRGFTVLGVPSNQFMQELKSSDDISEYCSTTWGVTFPMTEKVKVNGKGAHPLYQQLTSTKDVNGVSGRIMWNFEKFLLSPDGQVVRFRPTVTPDDPEVITAIERALEKLGH